MLRKVKPWTTGEIRRVREMRLQNLTTEEIAERTGRTFWSVQTVIKRFRIPRGCDCGEYRAQRPWTGREEESLREMFTEGRPLRQMAFKLNRSRDAVSKRLTRLGLVRDRRAVWQRLLAEPHNVRQVAERMGVSPEYVYELRWKLRRAGCPIGPTLGPVGRPRGSGRKKLPTLRDGDGCARIV